MKNSNFVANDLVTFKNSQNLKARGSILKLSQNHIVFEVYNPYSIVQLSEVLTEFKINKEQREIYNGRAVITNLINTGLLLVVSATLIDSFSIQFIKDESVDVTEEAIEFIAEWNDLNKKILPDYQLSVNKLRSFFLETNRWLEQATISDNIKVKYSDEELLSKISEPFLNNLGELLLNFEDSSRKLEKSDIGVCKSFSQRELHPLVMQSPFIHRTFYKPLGYAGDYEMVNMMLRDPYEGESVYSKLINSFFISRGVAQAHRNRIDVLFDTLKQTALKAKNENRQANIFNFACGPAVEIQRFIEKEELSKYCRFTLLDFDKNTLEYTSKKLLDVRKNSGRQDIEIDYINRSAHDVLKQAIKTSDSKLKEGETFDFVYCAGLFDYLSDKVCSKLLKLFFKQLRPKGMVLATNVDISNPSRNFMEHVMEWYLIYRNKEGFAKLVENIETKKLYADETGYNIFLEMYQSKD